MLQTEITSSNYITGCEVKEQRSRIWILVVEKFKVIENQKSDTVIAEVAKTLESSNETKEFRISCLSPRPNLLSIESSIGRGCCCAIAIVELQLILECF